MGDWVHFAQANWMARALSGRTVEVLVRLPLNVGVAEEFQVSVLKKGSKRFHQLVFVAREYCLRFLAPLPAIHVVWTNNWRRR